MKKNATKSAHPWRPCPLGKHWVSAHPRNRVSSSGKRYAQHVDGHCRTNRSRKDHLYRDDIHEIADRHFAKLSGPPTADNFRFKVKGNQYDHLIRGWTRYWNDVLKPAESLDENTVKALIATESSFNPRAWNGRRGKNAAYGLTQVLHASVPLLGNPKELSDHFVNLTEDDMTDPNLAICAGVRWLFRKKQIMEANLKRPVSWRDAVAAYKSVKPDDKRLMPKFDEYYQKLNGVK